MAGPAPASADHLGTPLDTSLADLVAAFVRWVAEHGLAGRTWTVDDVWFLAAEDFGPATGFDLPPRRVFLGALQRVPGVAVAYDRRIYTRDGRVKAKTTMYALPAMNEAEPIRALAAQGCEVFLSSAKLCISTH